MRVHQRFVQLAPKIDPERFHRIVRADRVAAARIDIGYSGRIDNYAALDVTFSDGEQVVAISGIVVQGMHLYVREDSPFVWPAWLPPIRRDVVRAIEDQLEPWLRSLTLGRFAAGEQVVHLGNDARAHELFDRARAYGFLGAADTEHALLDTAPYVYALRFARDARIFVADPKGASGAAILARVGSVDVDLGDDERTQTARAWFGLEMFGSGAVRDAYDLAIGPRARLPKATVTIALDDAVEGERAVDVAAPVPMSLLVSFDLEDGQRATGFSVKAPQVPVRASSIVPAAVVGGSQGRIGLVLRDDYHSIDDADADAARAMARRLSEQGFLPALVASSRVRPGDFDLLHVYGYRVAPGLRKALGGLAPPPIVLEPVADDVKNEALWGATISAEALSNSIDDSTRELYGKAIAERLLVGANSAAIGASYAQDQDVRWLFATASAAIVASEDEERRIRDEFGFTGAVRIVPAVLADEVEPSLETGSLVGLREFVFAHAPLDARYAQFPLARVCAKLGYPLVLAGPVGSTEYYGDLLAGLGDDAVLLPHAETTPAQLAALYRRARVFCDLGWMGAGLYRSVRAGCAGAALVGSAAGFARTIWPGLVQIADPASTPSIAAAVQAAWEGAERLGPQTAKLTAERCRPFESLVAVLAAYQAAAQQAVS